MNRLEQTFNILIVDGLPCQQGTWCTDILESDGYSCTLVDEKEVTIDFIRQQSLDLLLIFFNMDRKGIFNGLKNIKAELSKRYIPVILLTEPFGEQGGSQSIEMYCDDFLVTPLNQAMLKAKLRFLLHTRVCHQKQLKNNKQLLEYQQFVDQEQTVAANLYEKILKHNYLETTVVKAAISSEALFNGDFLFVSRTPDNNLHILLGDFSSHGVLSVANPIADIFYSMTAKGFDIIEITTEINRKLYKLLPVNMFLATTMVAVYPDSKLLHLITCGLPEHFLVNRRNNTLKTVSSNNVPLGITI